MEKPNDHADGEKEDWTYSLTSDMPHPLVKKVFDELGEDTLAEPASPSQDEQYEIPLKSDGSVDWGTVTGAQYLRPPYTGDEPPFPDKPPAPEA